MRAVGDACSGCVRLGHDWTISQTSKLGPAKATVGDLTVPEPLQKKPTKQRRGWDSFNTFQKAVGQVKADALHYIVLAPPTSSSKTTRFWSGGTNLLRQPLRTGVLGLIGLVIWSGQWSHINNPLATSEENFSSRRVFNTPVCSVLGSIVRRVEAVRATSLIRCCHTFGERIHQSQFLVQISKSREQFRRNGFKRAFLTSGPLQQHLAELLKGVADVLRIV
jgi:hypothetical protein